MVVTPDGKVRREVEIPIKHGPMIHDCAFTQRFAIILDLPVTFSLMSAITRLSISLIAGTHRMRRAWACCRAKARRDDIIWCPIDPCYVFHAVNSYDAADGTVVLDVIVHDRMFSRSKAGPDSQRSGLERWIVDPVTRNVERTMIDPTPQEFPRPDERRLGQPYRYAYTMAHDRPVPRDRACSSTTWKTGTRQAHDFGPDRHPCEFVFVPAHAEAEEDEGWLIGFVIDAKAKDHGSRHPRRAQFRRRAAGQHPHSAHRAAGLPRQLVAGRLSERSKPGGMQCAFHL